MSEWQATTIADLGRVVTGSTPPSRNPGWFGESTPFVTPSDMTAGDRRPQPERWLSDDGRAGLRTRLVPGDSVAFVCIGATIGKVCLLPTESVTNQQINTVIPSAGTDSRFLYYLLMHAAPAIAQAASGAATPIINKSAFSNVAVRVPDHPTQSCIGQVLGGLDDLIENNRRRVEVLEEMARAIYREWFVEFRYPGHQDVPLVGSAVGPIPEGWMGHPFAEVASFVNGFAFKPSHWGSEGRPIIKIKELKQGVVAGTPRHPAESIAEKYWVERGDLLFSWSADLGVYLWNDEPGLLNQHLFTVRPTHPFLTIAFLFHALDQAMPQFRARAQGTTMRHIKRSALSEVQTSIPAEELLGRFTRAVEPMHEESARLRREATLLEALRDLLLPKLVTGQIDVSTLDLDALVSTSSTAGVGVA